MSFKFGCAKADITPDYPCYLRGYASRNRLSDGIADRLEVGTMVFSGNRKKVIHITVDSLGLNHKVCGDLIADISKKTGCNASDILISCSHTHFAPGVEEYYVTFPNGELELGIHDGDKKYYKLLLKQMLKSIGEAEKNMETVTVEEAEIMLPELSFNRRTVCKSDGKVITNYTWPKDDDKYDFQPIDPSMMVWRFRGKNGLKGILARYSAHPVTGNGDMYKISADYPGFFKKYVQEYFGCPGFFILGTNGDSVPIQREGVARDDIGNVMARAIRLAERRFRPAPDFRVGLTKLPIKLKLIVTTDRKTADAEFAKMLAKAKKKGACDDVFRYFGYKHSFCHLYPSDDVTLEMNIARLGTRVIVFLPTETLTEVGTKIRKPCPNALVVSASNGYDGYLPLAKEYKRGGYEATWGPRFHHTAADEIVKQAIEAIKSL